MRRDPQPVDYAEPAEHEPVEVAGLDQRELVQRDRPAGEQHLTQRPPLPAGFGPECGERVGIDEIVRLKQFAELAVAGFEFG